MPDRFQRAIVIPRSRDKDPVRSVGGELAHATGDQQRSWRQPFGGFKGTVSRQHGIGMAAVWIVSLPARLLDGTIWVYQRTVSPALTVLNPHCGCRFTPTCSHYARGALREHGLLAGVALTVVRLAKCGPWHPGGEDLVPPSSRPTCIAVRRQA